MKKLIVTGGSGFIGSNLVNFLISEESNMIRGQNIIIDGGRSLVI